MMTLATASASMLAERSTRIKVRSPPSLQTRKILAIAFAFELTDLFARFVLLGLNRQKALDLLFAAI